MLDTRHDIINFWFVETGPSLWFQVNADFDALVRDRFLLSHEMARDGVCDLWRNNVEGCLALCLLLDQFPRNMFRGRPTAYATDGKALVVAKHAVAKGFDQLLAPEKRRFLYLPFQHSEKLPDQKKSVDLFAGMKREDPLAYEKALQSLTVIDEFGRFPRRNALLGRISTPQEDEHIAEMAKRS